MSEVNNKPQSSTLQTSDDKGKMTCHLVSLPQIILTRIDEGNLPIPSRISPSLKKPVKRLGKQKSKQSVPLKKSVLKKDVTIKEAPKRERRKKQFNFNSKELDLKKKSPVLKNNPSPKTSFSKSVPKITQKSPKSEVKNMLKKTMLQKRSKIAIPPAKTPKSIRVKANKQTKVAVSTQLKSKTPPKIKVDVSLTKPMDLDMSEDEFLYDELIEELENSPKIQSVTKTPVLEKTTNITLKPNTGNKPPTIVKGGIVKKSVLPVDLKLVSSPSNLNSVKQNSNINNVEKELPVKDVESLTNIISSENPPKKASPWPVSIGSPTKPGKDINLNKSKRKPGPVPKKNVSATPIKKPKFSSKPPLTNNSIAQPQLANNQTKKPKIGPKQFVSKDIHISTPLPEDDGLSDEYTEEERLENEFDPDYSFPKQNASKETTDNFKNISSNNTKNENPKSTPTNGAYDDENPNIDLLRILTDDSEEAQLSQPEPQEEVVTVSADEVNDTRLETPSNKNPSSAEHNKEVQSKIDEEPPVRTIYDLMNEVSLQYPSWNLHIIPETNAFCIAQVTKGRLGLPTLKKCIELDPEDYNAKVYIHQYHIKRFDGIYDSEESIVALIQEINSIKA